MFFRTKKRTEHRHMFQCPALRLPEHVNNTYGYELLECNERCGAVTLCMPSSFRCAPPEHRQAVQEWLHSEGKYLV